MFIAPTQKKSFRRGAGGRSNSGCKHVTPRGVKTNLKVPTPTCQKSLTAPVVALPQVAHTCSRQASCLCANVEIAQCA